ncbi:unnamed protein product, partial [Pocillopora meandrina]
LKGIALQQLQTNLQNIQYLIIDEYSFVGQSLFGWIDCRCRQATGLADQAFGGLSVILVGARVMLTMNMWTEVGLCNGALGTVLDFVYADGQTPPALPICVLVQFDEQYNGPSL